MQYVGCQDNFVISSVLSLHLHTTGTGQHLNLSALCRHHRKTSVVDLEDLSSSQILRMRQLHRGRWDCARSQLSVSKITGSRGCILPGSRDNIEREFEIDTKWLCECL